MAEGFLLGPNLLSQIRRTIDRVDGEPIGSGFRRTQVILEGEEPRSAKVFRICTFTGSWEINETKTVNFKYVPGATNTVNVTNLFFPWTTTATGSSTDCAIAKDGTAWFLIDVPFETATAVFVGSTTAGIGVSSTQLTSLITNITITAAINTSNCTISVGRTIHTASAIVVTGTSTTTLVQSTFTSTFLKLKA